MDRQVANKILTNLDETAGRLDALAKGGKINPKVASQLVRAIDNFADRFQVAAFGEDNLKNHQAKVIKQDSDEPYMKTYDNPNKPIQTDPDEPYMHKVDKSFNSDAIDTYDADRSSTVTDRKEHDIRDVSEHSDGTKPQPSWTGGKGGKSVRSSSARSPKPAKTWS